MTLTDRLRTAFPWGVETGIRATVLTLVSGIGLIVIWSEMSGGTNVNRELTWLTVGIGAVLVGMYAQVTLVVRARRAIGERRESLIRGSVSDVGIGSLATTNRRADPDSGADAQTPHVAVGQGLVLYHLPGCLMVSTRDYSLIPLEQAKFSGREACGICCAGQPASPQRVRFEVGEA
jgi:hypothetical protein